MDGAETEGSKPNPMECCRYYARLYLVSASIRLLRAGKDMAQWRGCYMQAFDCYL